MTQHELYAVENAFERSLRIGAPGIAETARAAIISAALRRLRHQFNIPAPPLPAIGHPDDRSGTSAD